MFFTFLCIERNDLVIKETEEADNPFKYPMAYPNGKFENLELGKDT